MEHRFLQSMLFFIIKSLNFITCRTIYNHNTMKKLFTLCFFGIALMLSTQNATAQKGKEGKNVQPLKAAVVQKKAPEKKPVEKLNNL